MKKLLRLLRLCRSRPTCCSHTAVALLMGASSTCMACSVPGPHTSEELVRDAESIVLAKVIAGTPEHFENPKWESIELIAFLDRKGPGPLVKFETVETVKGKSPGQHFNLVGSLKYFGPHTGKVPYYHARPGGQRGFCFAYDYKLGGIFLLFLKSGTPYWSAVRPTNEEVRGSQDPWLLWVKAQMQRPRRSPPLNSDGLPSEPLNRAQRDARGSNGGALEP